MSGHVHARGQRVRSGLQGALESRYTTAVIALLVLVVLSPFLAPGSLGPSALLSMLPFAAIVAIAAAGQTIIVQQAGIDLSVPGAISLSAVLLNTVANGDDGRIFPAIATAVAGTVAAGVITGMAVSWFSVTPFVATLAVNGLLLGAVLAISGGQNPIAAPQSITEFALGRFAGVPDLVILAIVVLVLLSFWTTRTSYARRFVTVGVSVRTARAAGIHTTAYTLSAFALAGLCYGLAGVMVAAYSGSPGLFVGNNYLLPSIAAVVIGGTALTGGRGSLTATSLGALFLTQLDQVVSGVGGPTSVQEIVQGIVILLALTLHGLIIRVRRRFLRNTAPPPQLDGDDLRRGESAKTIAG